MAWLDWVLGRQCLFCGRTVDPQSEGICTECAARIAEENLEISAEETGAVISLYRYAGPVREGLHRFKYGGVADLGIDCGQKLALLFRELGRHGDVVTCVPRAKDGAPRLYNQSRVIAEAFAKALNLPLDDALLRKRNGARTQPECVDRHARLRNAEHAYRKGPSPRNIEGQTVVLIDDLYTSGATAQVCTEILKKRGAAQVIICTAMQTKAPAPRLVRSESFEHRHIALVDESDYRGRVFTKK